MQKQMSTALAPLHLLLFGGTLADNGIHSASRPPRECHTNPYALLFLLFFFFNVFQQRYTGQIGSEGAQAVSLALYPLCSRATVRSSVSNTAGDTPAAALRPAEWSAQNTA